MIKTEAGEKMKEENPVDGIKTIDGQELLRQELEKQSKKFGVSDMNMGGLMCGGMGVTIGIEEESGNEIPAGSMPQEVADDIPAMLSEGEYVIPADVVRWHGVKQFEMMRQEAKMGMGLMAEDGRIAEVEHEEHEYEIEEKDKPEVEKATVKVVEAAEGIITMPEAPDPVVPARYRLTQEIDPQTGRIVYVYRDPVTGETVTPEEFKPELSTRMSPGEIIQREVYGKEYKECGEGFIYDPDTDTCVPVSPEAVAEPSVDVPTGDGGGGGGFESYTPQYADRLGTKLAESLGPLSAEDLATQPGATLADKAFSRMTQPTDAKPSIFPGVGMLIAEGQRFYDEVGASRAALTRANELSKTALGLDASKLPRTYNYTFDPETASFKATSSTKITELQRGENGGAWASDYAHTDPTTGKEVDPFKMTDDEFESWIDAVDKADFRSLSAVSGDGKASTSLSSDQIGTGTATGLSGINTDWSEEDQDSEDNSSPSNNDGVSDSVGSDPDDWSGGGEEWNKGGYVTKKNKPKVATMQYSKGSK